MHGRVRTGSAHPAVHNFLHYKRACDIALIPNIQDFFQAKRLAGKFSPTKACP